MRKRALKAGNISDQRRQLSNGDIMTHTDIRKLGMVGLLKQKRTGVGEVVDIEEFAFGRASTPNCDFCPLARFVLAQLGLVKFTDKSRQDVACLKVEIVIRAIKIGRHDA